MSEPDQPSTYIDCRWCETHIDGPCPECERARRQAVRLRDDQGLCLPEIATRLGASEPRAGRLLEEADQALDLQRFKLDTVPVATLRAVFERRNSEDPSLTEASIARAAKIHRIDLRRALGRSAPKNRPTATQQQVTVALASKVVVALGIAPHEIEGL